MKAMGRNQWVSSATAILLSLSMLSACGGGSSSNDSSSNDEGDAAGTPSSLALSFLGRYSTESFGTSSAEITAFDPATKRAFVVNAQAGQLDVLDLSDPTSPQRIDGIDVTPIASGATVNSVAIANGIVAVAIEAATKTDTGFVAFYRANDLSLIDSVSVGALPDMLIFTPDGQNVLVANEAEPSDDYQTDPEGSISIIDVSDLGNIAVRTAGFDGFNDDAATLRAAGVRIFGPNNATVAQDLEPEYIAVSADSTTAWAVLQENNALAKIDIGTATVTDIIPLGYKDHSLTGNGLDTSDDGVINIATRGGLRGMYNPDAIQAYTVGSQTYLVTANEGDARAWGEDTPAYFGDKGTATPGDPSLGFVEEFRVKHLVHASGFDRRLGDDLPPQLRALAAGALLNPATFAYCGATAGNPGACRDDEILGRLNVTWTEGYRKHLNGAPVMFNAAGVEDAINGDRLMYDHLYAFGGRSFAIWNADGGLAFDSGDLIERFLASNQCFAGASRTIPCRDFFNSTHDEGNALENRSDNKGPEPEGLTIGRIGDKNFLFLGLERMGGVLVYDISNPQAPTFVDYLNTREDWTTADPGTVLSTVGDLGIEGLTFVSATDSPNGKPLLVAGNEVSGTTAIYQVNLSY